MKELWKLFCLFFKIGLFTFGGGYAMLPLLKAEIVDKRRFVTEQELLDLYSIGQCTPGVIAVNVATYIGYIRRGVIGAIVTTIGIVAPSVCIILLVASVLRESMDNRYVAYAFAGIRICIVALIVDVVYNLARKNVKNYTDGIIFAGALALCAACHLSAVVIVLIAGSMGLVVGEIKRKRQ